MKKTTGFVVAGVVLALIVLGSFAVDEKVDNPDRIKIGVIAPITGPARSTGSIRTLKIFLPSRIVRVFSSPVLEKCFRGSRKSKAFHEAIVQLRFNLPYVPFCIR